MNELYNTSLSLFNVPVAHRTMHSIRQVYCRKHKRTCTCISKSCKKKHVRLVVSLRRTSVSSNFFFRSLELRANEVRLYLRTLLYRPLVESIHNNIPKEQKELVNILIST